MKSQDTSLSQSIAPELVLAVAAQDLEKGMLVTWDYAFETVTARVARIVRAYDPRKDANSPWRMSETARKGATIGLSLDHLSIGLVM